MAMYEVPNEMRDFAERSVQQARKAFETFMGVVHQTSGAVDVSANPALSSAKDMSSKAVVYAEKNVNAAFDLAQKLVHAKDVSEVFSLQSDYVRSQFESIQEQARDLGQAMQRAGGNVGEAMQRAGGNVSEAMQRAGGVKS